MKNKLKIILLIILSLGVICIISLSNDIKKEDSSTTKDDKMLSTDLLKRMDNKEDMLIYLTDNSTKCDSCLSIGKMLEFYEKRYDIKFIVFDMSKRSDKDYKNLFKNFDNGFQNVEAPCVIYIKNGSLHSSIISIPVEEMFKNMLIENNIIDGNKYKNVEIPMTYSEYKKIEKSDNNELLLLTHIGDDGLSYVLRDKLLDLALENNFSYRLVDIFSDEGRLIYYDLRKIKDDLGYNNPIVIFRNKKLIVYNNKNELKNFLIKNNIIN